MTRPDPDIHGLMHAHKAVEQYRDELEISLAAVTAERDRYRQMIEGAPHARNCLADFNGPCGCWKSDMT